MSIYDERPDDDYDVYIGNEPVRYQRRAKWENYSGRILLVIFFIFFVISLMV